MKKPVVSCLACQSIVDKDLFERVSLSGSVSFSDVLAFKNQGKPVTFDCCKHVSFSIASDWTLVVGLI